MKKLFIVLFLFSCASFIQAQWIVQGFESAVADSVFSHAPAPGLQTGEGALVLTDVTDDKYHGNGAMKVDWLVHSTESWGGYSQIVYNVPQEDSTYMDWSSAKSIRLWYNNITPSSQTGLVEFRMQLYESGGAADYWSNNTDHETWYFNGGTVLYDNTPGWKSIVIPLVDRGEGVNPNNEGFSLPGWAGVRNDGVLQLDKVVGYSFEFETPGIADNGKAQGSIIFDKMEFFETAYPPVTTFDNTATDFFALDDMGWAGDAAKGAITLTDITTDPLEGASSLQIDFKVNNSQTWGGYVNAEHKLPDGTFLEDLSGNQALFMYIKVLTPTTASADRVTMRFFLFDVSTGTREPWQMTVPVDLYTASDWQLIRLPLDNKGVGGGLRRDGFVIPDWETANQGDGNLNLDKIGAWKIEFSGSADAPYVQGEICEGSILVDLLTPGGYRETDLTPPPAPDGIAAVAGDKTNLITWNDVPGETGETYDIYYSDKEITVTNPEEDPALEVVSAGVAENTSLYEHLLRAPGVDQDVTYYYAVSANDKAGNKGPLGKSGAITNTAKGVVTITPISIPDFAADGDLKEWANIKPIHMALSDASAFLAANGEVDNDADLSLDAYVAVDATYLYVAFEVTDDQVVFRAELDPWLNDAPDMFIGLYNWHGAPHGAYRRGAEPDYHLRFAKNRLMNEGGNGNIDSLLLPGENYYWDLSFTGYVVEARIPLADLANKRNPGNTSYDNVFVPAKGMRIPLDFSINDNDSPTGDTNREAILCYSPYNNDQSHATTSRWLYTWIGDQWVVGVNDKESNVLTYKLDQNYPNPFNPSTQIRYSIEKAGMVSIKIFDMLGREIKELVNQHQAPGVYTVDFNASGLSTGVYVYQINSGSFSSSKKMLLMK